MTTSPSLKGITVNRPLEGIRVLDNTRALAGPYASFLLTLMGAEVIRIQDASQAERLSAPYVGTDGAKVVSDSPDDVSFAEITRHRGKKSLTLNLYDKRSLDVWDRLVASSDVVIENYAAGVADKIGVGYARAREVNPRIIYTAISGFGSDEKYHGAPAMDALVQSLSGVMLASGEEEHPPVRIGFPIADLSAPMFAVIGILAALRERDLSGEGQMVDVSMLGAMTAMMATESWEYFEELGMKVRTGGRLQRLTPWGVFQTADGWVTIVGVKEKWLDAIVESMGEPGILQEERFSTRDLRVQNRLEFEARIEAWTRSLPTTEVVGTLTGRGVPCVTVREPAEAVLDPDALERGDVTRIPFADGKSSVLGTSLPIRFSRTPREQEFTVARRGEHTDELLTELGGYSQDEIAQLRADGVI